MQRRSAKATPSEPQKIDLAQRYLEITSLRLIVDKAEQAHSARALRDESAANDQGLI
jgi:hypothetical protein